MLSPRLFGVRVVSLYERDPFPHQLDSEPEEVWSIHREYVNGRAADRGPPCNSRSLELKVPDPEVSTRMKQANEFTRDGIESRDVRPFVTVAVRASEGEIVQHAFSPVLLGDYVIQLEWQWKGELRDSAIFAALSCAIPHRSRQLTVHSCERSVFGFEQVPRFGLHYTEQESDMQIAIEFLRFGVG